MAQNDKALLQRLVEHKVEFVIIGGVCGVLHGLSLVTLDLDICCSFDRENLRRLEAAVHDLNPRHRLATQKPPLKLTDELCDRLQNLYLQTDLGILDCLGSVAGIGGYQEVVNQSVPQALSIGVVRILSLDALITAKTAAGRRKDLDAVTLLKSIKEKLNNESP